MTMIKLGDDFTAYVLVMMCVLWTKKMRRFA